MKRIIVILMMMCMTIPVCGLASTEMRYCTAQEVYHDVQTVLAEGNGDGTITLETRKGPLTIAVPMPDVDKVPILRVAYAGPDTFPAERPEGTTGYVPGADNNDETVWRVMNGTWEELVGEDVPYHTTHLRIKDDPAMIADGSPFSREEAIEFADKMLNQYAVPLGYDLRLDTVWTCSREYKAVDHGQGFVPYLDQPVTDTGYYELEYEQFLHGIPYWHGRGPYLTRPKVWNLIQPVGEAWGMIFSPEHYFFQMAPVVEKEMLAEDIPLCPFEKILEIISGASSPEGNELRFGYLLHKDPEREDTSIVVPYWILLTADYYSENDLYMNAQTGEIVDRQKKDTDGHRGDAVWFGWDKL